MNQDLKTMSIEQLKAIGYDMVLALDGAQKNIQLINQELATREGKALEPNQP